MPLYKNVPGKHSELMLHNFSELYEPQKLISSPAGTMKPIISQKAETELRQLFFLSTAPPSHLAFSPKKVCGRKRKGVAAP